MSIFRKNIFFFVPCILFILLGALLNIEFSQKEIFYAINHHHTPLVDSFLRYYTNVGDGYFFLFIIVLFSLFSFRNAIIGFAIFVLQGILIQGLKQIVFPDHIRPWLALSADKNIHLVPDFHPFVNNSFPSGHSATAFCMFTFLTILNPNKSSGLLYFTLALLVVYSRIYLVQHFFIDTYFGAIIGILCTLAIYLSLQNKLNASWAIKGLLTLKSAKA